MMRFLTLAKERPGEGHCRQRKAKRQGCFRRTVRPEGNGGFIHFLREMEGNAAICCSGETQRWGGD